MSAQLFYLPFQAAVKPTNVGAPGSKAYFYQPGTTTLKPVYATSALTTQLSNPVVADGAGRFANIYLDGATTYKLVINDKNGTLLYQKDPYVPGSFIVDLTVAAVTPQIDGALGDGVTDDHTALQAWLDRGGLLRLPVGEFYSSDNLILRKNAVIEGDGYGFDNRIVDATADLGYDDQPGSKIRFAAGKGFTIQGQATVTDVATVAANITLYFVQEGAYGSVIRNLALIGPGTGASATGCYIRTFCHLENVHAIKFQGKGFDLSASANVPDGNSEYGNLSGASLTNCVSKSNGSHGLHIRGNDANTCNIVNLTTALNGGWGILNESVIGNLFVKPQIAGNTSGSISVPGSSGSHFVQPYIEADAHANSSLNLNCTVTGIDLTANNTGSPSYFSVQPSLNKTKFIGTWAPESQTAEAALAYKWDGLYLQGRGSTKDVALVNRNGTVAAHVPTNSTNFTVAGTSSANVFQSSGTNGAWPGVADGYIAVLPMAIYGIALGGSGSSYDVSLFNKSGVLAGGVPTGTTNVSIIGTITASNLSGTNTGDGAYTIQTKIAGYTATETTGDIIVKCDLAAGFTAVLPTAVGNKARFTFKKIQAAGAIIIDGAGTETIDGGLTATLNAQNESITIVSDNANWMII